MDGHTPEQRLIDERLIMAWGVLSRRLKGALADLRQAARKGNTLTGGNDWAAASVSALEEFGERADRAMSQADRVLDSGRELLTITTDPSTDLSPMVRGLIRKTLPALDRVAQAGSDLREQLFVAEIGERMADPQRLDAALIDWGMDDTSDNRWAIEHVLVRPPRRGTEANWRRKIRPRTPEQFYEWLRRAVTGAVRDLGRPGRQRRSGRLRLTEPEQEAELLQVVDRANLSIRETEILLAVARGERTVDVARRIGIKPSTARVYLYRAHQKINKRIA